MIYKLALNKIILRLKMNTNKHWFCKTAGEFPVIPSRFPVS